MSQRCAFVFTSFKLLADSSACLPNYRNRLFRRSSRNIQRQHKRSSRIVILQASQRLRSHFNARCCHIKRLHRWNRRNSCRHPVYGICCRQRRCSMFIRIIRNSLKPKFIASQRCKLSNHRLCLILRSKPSMQRQHIHPYHSPSYALARTSASSARCCASKSSGSANSSANSTSSADATGKPASSPFCLLSSHERIVPMDSIALPTSLCLLIVSPVWHREYYLLTRLDCSASSFVMQIITLQPFLRVSPLLSFPCYRPFSQISPLLRFPRHRPFSQISPLLNFPDIVLLEFTRLERATLTVSEPGGYRA